MAHNAAEATEEMHNMFPNFAEAITALARDAAFTELTKTSTMLMAKMVAKELEMWVLRAEVDTLRAQFQNLPMYPGSTGHHTGGSGGGEQLVGKKHFNNKYYCWTHAFDIQDDHTSISCKHP